MLTVYKYVPKVVCKLNIYTLSDFSFIKVVYSLHEFEDFFTSKYLVSTVYHKTFRK